VQSTNINKLVHTRTHSVAEQIVTCVYFCVRSTNVNKLGADLEAAKKEAQARDASAENKAKKKKGYVEEFEGNKVLTPQPCVCLANLILISSFSTPAPCYEAHIIISYV
jgi:hypothetical protein